MKSSITGLTILTIVFMPLTGCGLSINKRLGASSTEQQPTTAAAKDTSLFRMRWFPVDEAVSYKLYVLSPDGKLLQETNVTPEGCTHKEKDGYTSGVCSVSQELPKVAKPFVVKLSAIDKMGKEGQATTRSVSE